MGIQDNIKNAILSGGGAAPDPSGNEPFQYMTRRTRYFDDVSTQFIEQYAEYSSNFFVASAQGLDPCDPKKWDIIHLRMADIIKPSAFGTKSYDNYKQILIVGGGYTYVPPGTKFVTMGSVWLSTNPANISGSDGMGIIQRCNATWRHLDYYGNVLTEPFCIEKILAAANDPDAQETGLVTKGNFVVRCQYNEQTRQLDQNSRIMLGRNIYHITGFSDFGQEFTNDYDSVRLLEFTVRYEEPNDEIDDLERHIAGGKAFSWDINISGSPTMRTGGTTTLTAASMRNGETVISSAALPVSYIWDSSDTSIATVDENTGLLAAVGKGECTITASLAQNIDISESFTLSVEGADADPHVEILGTVPETLSAYQNISLSAAYFQNGDQTGNPVEWSFSGADKTAYSVAVDGNDITVYCWDGSVEPLAITASYEDYAITVFMSLLGVG